MRAHVCAGLRGLLGVIGLLCVLGLLGVPGLHSLLGLRGLLGFYDSLGSLGVRGLLGCAWGSQLGWLRGPCERTSLACSCGRHGLDLDG